MPELRFARFLLLTSSFFICGFAYNGWAQDTILSKIKLSAADDFHHFIETQNDPSTISGTSLLDYHSSIKKAYLFNGNFNLPYTIGGRYLSAGKKKNFYQSLQFCPEIKIRLFQNDQNFKDKSKPVRTPSYIPRISYFFTNQRFWNEQSPKHLFAGISALHHSNGSDGWEFDYQDSVVNIYNGSFSESLYFHFLLGGYKEQLKGSVSKNTQTVFKMQRWSWRSGFEFHPAYFANEKFRESKLYGGNRLFALFTWQQLFFDSNQKDQNDLNIPWLAERWRATFHLEYITDLSYDKGTLAKHEAIAFFETQKRLNICLTLMHHFRKIPYLGVFIQTAYYGSDNYNIYFQYSNYVFRGGIALAFFENRPLNNLR